MITLQPAFNCNEYHYNSIKYSYFSKQQHLVADARILIPSSLISGGNLNSFLATAVLNPYPSNVKNMVSSK
jgi:hypothetical protein